MGNEASGPKGLTVVVCYPDQRGLKSKIIEGDELEGLQKILGGFVESIGQLPWKEGLVLDVYVNEEGLRLGLPQNRLVRIGSKSFPVVGPIVVAGLDPQTGENVSLGVEDLVKVATQVASWPLPIGRVSRD